MVLIMKTLIILSSLLVFVSGSAQASVFLSDSFDSATSGLNDNLATRQAGSEANKDWLAGGNGASTIVSDELLITHSGNSSDRNVYLDLDLRSTSGLLAGGSFTISFDMTANSSYSGFFIGSDNLGGRPMVGPLANNDFQMLIRSSSGNSSVYYDGGSSSYGTASVGTGMKSWVFTFDTVDFDSGTPYTASLTIDGSEYDLNAGAAGTTLSRNWDGGAQYIGFTTRNSNTIVDNFELAVIPEPSALLLAVVGLLGCGLFRRRK
jgi:hypothetical protein